MFVFKLKCTSEEYLTQRRKERRKVAKTNMVFSLRLCGFLCGFA
jgi:hypothetical protein